MTLRHAWLFIPFALLLGVMPAFGLRLVGDSSPTPTSLVNLPGKPESVSDFDKARALRARRERAQAEAAAAHRALLRHRALVRARQAAAQRAAARRAAAAHAARTRVKRRARSGAPQTTGRSTPVSSQPAPAPAPAPRPSPQRTSTPTSGSGGGGAVKTFDDSG